MKEQRKDFAQFRQLLEKAPDRLRRTRLLDSFFQTTSIPVVEGTQVHFLFRGKASTVSVPSELNSWSPGRASMQRISRTNLFYRSETLPLGARLEYKLCVDDVWILDPCNEKRAEGGYGENSDLWMPGYCPPPEVQPNPGLQGGSIELVWITSRYLNRRHPVFIYLPAGMSSSKRYPVVYVTDGGEYLTLGKMHIILDNLIATRRIKSVIGVFIDPRTELGRRTSNRRLVQYAANNRYVNFLEHEVATLVERSYPASRRVSDRLVLGASMGGLMATYVGLKRPSFTANCAAQSPAFLEAFGAVPLLIEMGGRIRGRFHLDTGTLNDAELETRSVAVALKSKGAEVSLVCSPEGHNWSNWRARLPGLLEYFFRPR